MFFRFPLLSLFIVLISCTGCSIRRPLLVKDQEKLIIGRDQSLRGYAETVQDHIQSSGSSTALVVFQKNLTAPAIYPTANPASTALEHYDEISHGTLCFIVFVRTLPLPPEQLSCDLLATQAIDLSKSRKRDLDVDATFAKTNSDIEGLRANLATLKAAVESLRVQATAISGRIDQQQSMLQDQRETLNRDGTDIAKLASVLSPTAKLVQFHQVQLQNTEKTLGTLIDQYSKTAAAIGQNNQQIDTMITDINRSFAQVKATLDQMQQKLATVR